MEKPITSLHPFLRCPSFRSSGYVSVRHPTVVVVDSTERVTQVLRESSNSKKLNRKGRTIVYTKPLEQTIKNQRVVDLYLNHDVFSVVQNPF